MAAAQRVSRDLSGRRVIPDPFMAILLQFSKKDAYRPSMASSWFQGETVNGKGDKANDSLHRREMKMVGAEGFEPPTYSV